MPPPVPGTPTLRNRCPIRAARPWEAYAREPQPEDSMLPGRSKDLENRLVQRRPRKPMTIIFRELPALAQSSLAERLEEEGWFDDDRWLPDWFAERGRGPIARPHHKPAEEAWERAHAMWERYGQG